MQVIARNKPILLIEAILTQVALADFLSSGGYDSHLRRIRRAFQHNIAHMTRAIDKTFPKAPR
jgi:DNA-binding transcriptional MocR family regulator